MWFRPSNETQVEMYSWSVKQVQCKRLNSSTRHLVGLVNGIGRVCSPIQNFDKSTMKVKSRSGKIYVLCGDAGTDSDAEYTFDMWCRMNGIDDVVDVTDEYCNR